MKINMETLTEHDTHEQVPVTITYWDGDTTTFDCDYYIADLIGKLNEKGFYTKYCCSGHEEDYFVSMYISFFPLNEKKELDLLMMLNNVPELYTERVYVLDLPYGIRRNMHHVKLTDPTPDELEMARELVFGKDYDPDEFRFCEEQHIVIRPKCHQVTIENMLNAKDCLDSSAYDYNIKHIEDNKKEVLTGIQKLTELVESTVVEDEDID